jgi:hypothetical protein
MTLNPISIWDIEDEMIVLNQNNKWLKTIYASCPEQALAFYLAFKDKQYSTTEKWQTTLKDFQIGWECAEEDYD